MTLLLGLLICGAQAGLTQLRVDDAARAGARMAARGESAATVGAESGRVAGSSAAVAVSATDGYITVSVSSPVDGPFGALFALTARSSVTARSEGLP